MNIVQELFNTFNLKILLNDDEISFSQLQLMIQVLQDHKKNSNRCLGFYIASGKRCKTKASGYCQKHSSQQHPQHIRNINFQVEYIDNLTTSTPTKKVINNLVYDIYNNNQVFRNDIYIGQYINNTLIPQ